MCLQFIKFQVHLSFSLYGAEDDGQSGNKKQPTIQWEVLSLFLQSIGVVLTDVQDVVFKYVIIKFSCYSLSFMSICETVKTKLRQGCV